MNNIDPEQLTHEERKCFRETIGNKLWRIQTFYKIRDKKRQTVNLVLNPLQSLYWRERTNRDIILKARKIGFSTLCLIDDLDETIWNRNYTSFIMAHRREDVQKLFQIVHFAFDSIPPEWKQKTEYYNKNELFFKDRNSRIYVGTEARSDVVNRLHVSEVAFIEDAEKKMAASFEAVPEDGSIVLETTPNGIGGYFYDLYQVAAGYTEGRSEFKPHFYPWFKHPDYSVRLTKTEKAQVEEGNYLDDEEKEFRETHNLNYSQMKWRKLKKERLGDQFDEQYPEDNCSCFLGSGNPYFDMKKLKEQMAMEAT